MAEETVEQKLCPKIETTNNNMMDLSYDERLGIVEKEVQSLYEFCLQKKFTNKEVHNCVSNLYGPQKSLAKKVLDDSARPLFILSGIIGLLAVLLVQPKIWSLAIVHAKLFSIKVVLPYWDWASLYDEDCMLSNHWLPEKVVNITADQCKYCENSFVDRLKNVKHSFVTDVVGSEEEKGLFVVSDTTKDWSGETKFTMDDLIHNYQHHSALSNTLGSCVFQNDAGFNDMFYDFFNAYADKKLPVHWHANWVNCDVKAAKVIRHYHPRPYFLPPMMQLKSENVVIVASGRNLDATFTIPDTSDERSKSEGKWVTVLSGSFRFTFKPLEECSEKYGCKNVVVTLLPGETLFYILEPWEMYYSPVDNGISIAISNDAVWDEM